MQPEYRVLIVEDQVDIAEFLRLEFEHEGYIVAYHTHGRQGLEAALTESWDLMLLDIMLPGISGLEICRRVRVQSDVPIIMLTARQSIHDRVAGLDTGADDYVVKPFAIEEVLARARALIRRNKVQQDAEILRYHDVELNTATREVKKCSQVIELTPREFGLLEMFLRNANHVLTRQQILQHVWGYDFLGETNLVDVYVRYLRNKIDAPFRDPLIQTIRGVGYVFKLQTKG